MQDEKYYCEKCGSEAVSITVVKPETKKLDERKSIADFQAPPTMTTLEYRPITYKATCKNCGNSKEVTQ
jgi:transcription elongation factor Elf1